MSAVPPLPPELVSQHVLDIEIIGGMPEDEIDADLMDGDALGRGDAAEHAAIGIEHDPVVSAMRGGIESFGVSMLAIALPLLVIMRFGESMARG